MTTSRALAPFAKYTDKDWHLVKQRASVALVSREISTRGIFLRPTQVVDDGENVFALRHQFPQTIRHIVETGDPIFEVVACDKSTIKIRVPQSWLDACRQEPVTMTNPPSVVNSGFPQIRNTNPPSDSPPCDSEEGFLPSPVAEEQGGEVVGAQRAAPNTAPSDLSSPVELGQGDDVLLPSLRSGEGSGVGFEILTITQTVNDDHIWRKHDAELLDLLHQGWHIVYETVNTVGAVESEEGYPSNFVIYHSRILRLERTIPPLMIERPPETAIDTLENAPSKDGSLLPSLRSGEGSGVGLPPSLPKVVGEQHAAPSGEGLWNEPDLRAATRELFPDDTHHDAAITNLVKFGGIKKRLTPAQAREVVRRYAQDISDDKPITRLRVHVLDLEPGDQIEIVPLRGDMVALRFTIEKIEKTSDTDSAAPRTATGIYHETTGDWPGTYTLIVRSVALYYTVVGGPKLNAVNTERSLASHLMAGWTWRHILPSPTAVAS